MSRAERNYTIRLSAAGKAQLEADLKQIGSSGQRALGLIQRSTKPASAGLREVSRDSAAVQAQLRGIGQQVPAVQRLARLMSTTALTGSLVLFAKSALDVAKTFEASMKRVQAATRAPEDQIERLALKAKALGATTAFTATGAADAIEVLARNGLGVAEILGGALDATLSMAGALGGELAPSADLATDLMQQFGLAADELPRIADRIAGAALTSKFGFDDLRQAIGQAGGVAGKFGVDIDGFLTALSATASGFSSGADAGTSFKTFLQRLTPESKEARTAIADLGLEFFDAQGNLQTMENIAGQLQTALAGLSQEARQSSLKTIFGTDAIRTALLLADVGAEGFANLQGQVQAVSAAEQTEVRMQGLEGALREVASAWEALQLRSAEAGGLDLAEAAADRLAEALRYVTENFEQVEEVVERVAQALVVYLIGRGMRPLIAMLLARRAVLIEFAGAVTGMGTSAGRAARGLGRMAIAGRALSTLAGGPAGLLLTVATLGALFVNTDRAADAIEAAEAAADKAGRALEAYGQASQKARAEQAELGGAVSETTAKLLEQSEAALNTALADAERAMGEAESAAARMFKRLAVRIERPNYIGDQGGFVGMLFPEDVENDFLTRLANVSRAVSQGREPFAALAAEIEAIGRVPEQAEPLALWVEDLASNGEMAGKEWEKSSRQLREMANALGLFGVELDAIDAAGTADEAERAWMDLVKSMLEAMVASRRVAKELTEAERELLDQAVRTETRIGDLRDAINEVWGVVIGEDGEITLFDKIKEGALEAAVAVDALAGKTETALQVYARTRAHSDKVTKAQGISDAASRGILDLIARAEGTDGAPRSRGYNTTLDYGRWTGGPQNLTGMTLDEILALGLSMRTDENRATHAGGGSSALGRYQIVGTTLRGLMRQMDLSGTELYDPAMQDRLAMELVRQSGNAAGMQGTWQGLQNVSPSTISTALGQQPIPRIDPEINRTNAATAEQRRRTLEAERAALDALIATGDDHLAQLGLEQELIGKTAAEAEYLRFMFDKLREAKAAGVDVDATVTASGQTVRQVLEEQARAAAAAAEQIERTGKAIGEMSQEGQDARSMLGNIFEGLRNGSLTGTEAVGELFDYLQRRILEAAFDPLLDYLANLVGSLFTGGIGGQGGILGGLFGRAQGGPIQALAGGGDVQAGGRQLGRIDGRGGPSEDNILLWGSKGEYMHNAAAVRYYGLDFMDKLNAMAIPRLAGGGAVAPGFLTGGARRGDDRADGRPGQVFGDINVSVGDVGDRDPSQVGHEIAQAMADELPHAIDARMSRQMRPGGLLYGFATKGGR